MTHGLGPGRGPRQRADRAAGPVMAGGSASQLEEEWGRDLVMSGGGFGGVVIG